MNTNTDRMPYDLAVIMPIYNEEECIADVLKSWMAVLSGLSINYLIIALNDGSTDGTKDTLSIFLNEDRVEVVNKINSGHGPTILLGYNIARSEEHTSELHHIPLSRMPSSA